MHNACQLSFCLRKLTLLFKKLPPAKSFCQHCWQRYNRETATKLTSPLYPAQNSAVRFWPISLPSAIILRPSQPPLGHHSPACLSHPGITFLKHARSSSCNRFPNALAPLLSSFWARAPIPPLTVFQTATPSCIMPKTKPKQGNLPPPSRSVLPSS